MEDFTDSIYPQNMNLTTAATPSSATNQPNLGHPRTLHFVAIGIIIPIGLIFNMLSLAVFSGSPRLRKTTTGHYLMALAVADSLFLIGEFLRWLNTPNMHHINVTVNFMDRYDGVCKFVHLLRYTAQLASAWITVTITIERFITVAFPLKVSQISTLTIAKITIAVMYFGSFGLSLFTLWSVGVKPYKEETACLIISDKVYNIGNWVSLRVGSLLLPALLMSVFTCLIIFHLSQAHRVRTRRLSTNSVQSCKASSAYQVSRQISVNTLEKQLTLMLVAVAVAFLILRLPYTIMYYIQMYKFKMFPGLDTWTSYRIYYAYKMTDIFVSINYAINFFLYCFCGSAFRLQMKSMFNCQGKKSYLGRNLTATSSLHSRRGSAVSDHDNHVNHSTEGMKMVVAILGNKKHGDTKL